MQLGTAIKDLRQESGLRQKELASRVDVTQSYLSQIENDRKEPNLSTLRRIAQELGVSLPILFFLSMDEDDVRPDRKEAFDRFFPHFKNIVENQLLAGT
jgi:transcriptional regulator with XRE-family HTH domain